MAIAQRFQGPLQRSSKKAVYIDCNAVSIETVAAIAGEDLSTAQIFEGIADLYLQLAKNWKGERRDVAAIDHFLATKRL